jgi:prepilin-type N-terminal cleavage/methylation domain-containing protein
MQREPRMQRAPGRPVRTDHRSGPSLFLEPSGFTLVEVLLVVLLLAIMSAVVLPMFTESSDDARDATLYQNLQSMRRQIELYKIHHEGNPPGQSGFGTFEQVMTGFTSIKGELSAVEDTRHPLGPYLPDGPVVNPFNQGKAIKNSSNPAGETPDHSLMNLGQVVGWFYDPETGRISANAEGETQNGVPRISL